MQELILCAGGNEKFSFAKNIGIGLVEPCLKLPLLLQEFKPLKLVFIGTCGLYDEKDELLQIYQSQHAFNIEFSKLSNAFYSPAQCEINWDKKLEKKEPNETLAEFVSQETLKSNSSNYICADKKAAAEFLKLGLRLENMEIFSLLSVAKFYELELTCFLCASNYCDEKAHESFLKNHIECKKRLSAFLEEQNYI